MRLIRWLTQRATDDLLPSDLVSRAEEILRAWQVVLPVLSTLEELVASFSRTRERFKRGTMKRS